MRFPALVAAALALAAPATAAATPLLRQLGSSPLKIEGLHFAAAEHVRVTVTAKGIATATRSVRADSHGTFVVTFDRLKFGRCAFVSVKAIGESGSSATLKRTPRPACYPA